MRIIYAGTPEYAVKPLEALRGAGYEIAAVVTAPDKPQGRRGIVTPPPVKLCAERFGLPVRQYEKISDNVDDLKAFGADLMVTCAYGQILSDEVLSAFPKGVWNLHASLLPKFRGASPIQSAILAGEEYTGVTVMKTERELDAGDILLVKRCEVGDKTYGELEDELSELSALAVIEAMFFIEVGVPQLLLQDKAKATFCKKIQKSDARLDFSLSAKSLCRLVNAMNPAPLAYCKAGGSVMNVYRAEECVCDEDVVPGTVVKADRKEGIVVKCGEGGIKILTAQMSGGKPLPAKDLVNGRKIAAGDRLD
ncbi:MAG: methionyl-tRNA formyltransferase [Clostridia bacterium]|nr:methionyl-tRNA formyltransferase [Clostridia bacterium]